MSKILRDEQKRLMESYHKIIRPCGLSEDVSDEDNLIANGLMDRWFEIEKKIGKPKTKPKSNGILMKKCRLN